MFGGPEEIGIGEWFPRLGKLMTQLSAISWQIIEPGQNKEAIQSGIKGWRQNLLCINLSLRWNQLWKVTHQSAL
jgi:hypothetical protein